MNNWKPWEPEHSADLVRYLDAGFSHADAALALNNKYGTAYTRNSCIGRANRMGIHSNFKQRGRATWREPEKVVRRSPKPRVERQPSLTRHREKMPEKPQVEPELRSADIVPLLVTILEVSGCRWPYGDRPNTRFCNHPQFGGSSYCEHHWVLSLREYAA